jgi:Tfp pilus assembly protein PilF
VQTRAELRSSPDSRKEVLSYISNSLGYAYLKMDSLSQAQREFERAIEEDADNDDARRNLALVRILKARQ